MASNDPTSYDPFKIASECDRFLIGHGPKSVRERLQSVVDSPLSLERNDHYGRGGFVSQFEEELTQLLGQQAAVFMPSGTMAQQIALRIWSDRMGVSQVAFHPTCHLEKYEHMAYKELHGLTATLVGEEHRMFTLADLEAIDIPLSTLLIELPQREIGGQLPSWQELLDICDWARSRGIRLHLDGARLWECQPFYGKTCAEIGALFDSVYVSFYKTVFGFPGAALAGPADFIEEARIWQRRHGGNLQQQSPSAISAKLGLDRHLPQIEAYVDKAREVANILRGFDQVSIVPDFPPTNMMHLYFEGERDRLFDAAMQVSTEEKVGLFFGLGDDRKLELWIGEGALKISIEEIEKLFKRLFELANA
jgi:threonine aldolase